MIERIFDLVLRLIQKVKYTYLTVRMRRRIHANRSKTDESHQDLSIYSDSKFTHSVNTWGQDTAWSEIQFLLAPCGGRIIDMACGPCTVLHQLSHLSACDCYGCDISEYLIGEAIKSGIPSSRLTVCDATNTPFENDEFSHAYSMGSLEHFTEEGIESFLKECFRVAKDSSFHQIPTSRSGMNEGWIKLDQSYFNNSVDWWLKKFTSIYPKTYVLDSSWEDPISVGKWFICPK
jgi:ubiquinone/menaquinone biosynthesis C-methylase UbiE